MVKAFLFIKGERGSWVLAAEALMHSRRHLMDGLREGLSH